MSAGKYIDVSCFDALGAHGLSKVAVAVGVFDGVHRGHQRILEELRALAERTGSRPVAATFLPHPKELLKPDAPPALLLPPEVKLRLLHEYGAEAVISIPFTREFAALSPPEFLYDCLSSSRVELKGLCVGAKWRFGSGGSGDAAFLRERSAVSGFEFVAVDELEVDGAPVSSTRIRRAVSSGDLEGAVKLLGRDYSLYGKVEHGRHVAGPALDHPTANLRVRHGVLPPDGVYAGWAKWDGRRHRAALAIGSSPTFRDRFGTERRVELHLLDFAGDLYGLDLEAELLSWIREERRFENAEALKKQIDLDIKAINLALKGT